jgi:hypothetical protein
VVRFRIEEALGTKLDAAAALSFVANVQQKGAARWVVTLEVGPIATDASAADAAEERARAAESSTAKRTLEAPSCDELAQATSVAIALALGAEMVSSALQNDAESYSAPAAASADSAKSPVDATRAPRDATTKNKKVTERQYWFGGELGAVLDRGALPGWAPGVEGAVSFGIGAFSLRMGGLVLPRETTVTSGTAGGAFTLYAATAAACGRTARGAVQLRLCLGAEMGRLEGEGVNVANRHLGVSTWLAPGGEVGVSVPLGDPSLRLIARGGAVAPLIRKQFSVLGLGPVHQPAAVAGRLGLGLELLWQ